METEPGGAPDRTLICYRQAGVDPVGDPGLKTIRSRDAPVNRSEQMFLGAQYSNMVAAPRAFVVTAADHWVYAGTGLHDGDQIANLVRGEADRRFDGPVPDSLSYTILSTSPYITKYGAADSAESVIYQAPSGGWVFDAGAFGWATGVGPGQLQDSRVQRMTSNILARMADNLPDPMQARSWLTGN